MTTQELKAKGRPVLGYDDKTTVKLDFDNTKLKTVKYWAFRVLNFFSLEGFIILRSSHKCYHVVFNRPVSWTRNLHIIAWACQQSKHKKLTGWLIFQCIKESSTLRVGSKGRKKPPKTVFQYGFQDREIRSYLSYLKLLKKLEKIRCLEAN